MVTEQRKQWQKKYRQRNRKQLLAKAQQYYKKHKEKVAEKCRRYYLLHREERLQYSKQWAKDNAEYIAAYQKNWRDTHKEHVCKNKARYNLERKYGLSVQSYRQLCKQQKYKCAVCSKRRKLCVDHCHKTKKIRGLLCKQCNHMLGLAYDNTLILKQAIKYLNKSRVK